MLSTQKKVLQEYPKAGAQLLRAVAEAEEPFNERHWRIYRDDSEVSETIGRGPTEQDAWANAAKRLSMLTPC